MLLRTMTLNRTAGALNVQRTLNRSSAALNARRALRSLLQKFMFAVSCNKPFEPHHSCLLNSHRTSFLHYPQYLPCVESHFDNCAQATPHIFYRSTKQPNIFINYQISVMYSMRQLYIVNSGILFVMLLKIKLYLFRITCMHLCRHTVFSFIQHYQNTFIHIIVNQH